MRSADGRRRPSGRLPIPEVDDHLSDVFSGEEIEERRRGSLEAVNNRLLPFDLPIGDPPGDVALEILPNRHVVDGDEALQQEALLNNRIPPRL